MELRGLKTERVFYKFSGRYIIIEKDKIYASPEYTPLDLERYLRLFPSLLEKVVPKIAEIPKTEQKQKKKKTTVDEPEVDNA